MIEVSAEGMLRVHYTGWNTRYDEWIKPQRIALNVTQHEQRNKKVPAFLNPPNLAVCLVFTLYRV